MKKSLKVIEQLSRMLIEIFLINFFAILLFRCYLLFRVSLFFVRWYFHFPCKLQATAGRRKLQGFLKFVGISCKSVSIIYHIDFYERQNTFYIKSIFICLAAVQTTGPWLYGNVDELIEQVWMSDGTFVWMLLGRV